MSALFMKIAYELEDTPVRCVQRELVRATRRFLREHPPEEWFESPPEPSNFYEELAASYVNHDLDRIARESLRRRTIARRQDLLSHLSLSNSSQVERRRRAQDYVIEQLDLFIGWELECARGERFQLGEREPWWRPGDFFDNEYQRVQYGTREKLREQGFFQVARESYIERVRQPIMVKLLQETPSPFKTVAAIISLYTVPAREFDQRDRLANTILDALGTRCWSVLQMQQCTLPMKPLYSLPREANNISTFFVSRPESLEVNDDADVARSDLSTARFKVVHENHGQLALFYDTDLVAKKSSQTDTFISIKLEDGQNDVLGALMKAIEQFDINPNVFEHLPRVCAGMFSAAQRDRKHQFNWPGTFWDTDSGYRLCRIVGFNPDNPRHRKRVQDARQLLERLTLHRQTRSRDGQGRKVNARWSGPIIEPRAATLEIEIEDREGLSEHHTFRSWSIAKELWDMTQPEDEGGTPAFMILDQRAFELDDRSSLPFNLYWTLVNRAYMGAYTSISEDRVQPDGSFSPKIWTLHQWAGMETTHMKVKRIKRRFREALDLMVRHGLLERWEGSSLEDTARVSMEEFQDSRITVFFGPQQLQSLPTQVIDR